MMSVPLHVSKLRSLEPPKPVLITDFDGTLTCDDGKISPVVFKRLSELQEQGVFVVVCTGRSFAWGQMLAYTWPVDAVIAENGAFLFRGGHVETCFDDNSAGVNAGITLADERNELMALVNRLPGMTLSDDQAGRVRDVAALLLSTGGEQTDGCPASMDELRTWLVGHGYAYSIGGVAGTTQHLNMWKGNYDKSTAALQLIRKLGRREDEVVYIGDSPNDRCCFQTFPDNYGMAGVVKYPELVEHVCVVTKRGASDGFLEAVDDAFPPHAFATLVTNDFYAVGAVALAKSLSATGTRKPLLCLVGPSVTRKAVSNLDAVGVTVLSVAEIPLTDEFKERHSSETIQAVRPYNSKAMGGEKPRLFKNMDNFIKLRLWEQSHLSKIVYLDADTVVVQNIDELFEAPEFSVSHNFHVNAGQLNRINTGVFVLKPSRTTFGEMMEVLLTSPPEKLYGRTDQTFLEEFFEGRTRALDYKYNALQYTRVAYPEAWDELRIKVIHYIMQKPWDTEATKAKPPRIELKPLHDLWWAAYNIQVEEEVGWSGNEEEEGKAPSAVAVTTVTEATTSSDSSTSTSTSTSSIAASASPPEVLKNGDYKRIIVVGGDGFCGWPLSLRLSKAGHEVLIVDNLSRRRIDMELGVQSLTPIHTIQERLEAWTASTGLVIGFENIDVAQQYDRFAATVQSFCPTTIVHLGEQRAAPYSMKNADTRMYTTSNNLGATHSILNSIVEVDKSIHLVHLGTMGVYGYGLVKDTVIPEGYVTVKMKNRSGEWDEVEIMHPSYPGSVYHTTKVIDADILSFYAKNYALAITDLHQGIVWGLETEETRLAPELVNRIDYDSDYGTVLNRWIIQSACGVPLTVYGTGEQTRAFIHIQNSVQCMEMAIMAPAAQTDKRVKIFNQMTETHRILDLALLIQRLKPETKVQFLDNPRNELVGNELVVTNRNFLTLGLQPIFLEDESVIEIFDAVKTYRARLDPRHILPKSFW